MPKRQIFYSFHFDKDFMRVQQIRNIGELEDNKPMFAKDWEEMRKKGDEAIEKWIDDNMTPRSCVVVFVGEETAGRPWVKREIKKAWLEGKRLLGVYIHNLECPKEGKGKKGNNPFDQFTFKNGAKLSTKVKCYDPDENDAYNDIINNLENWVDESRLAY